MASQAVSLLCHQCVHQALIPFLAWMMMMALILRNHPLETLNSVLNEIQIENLETILTSPMLRWMMVLSMGLLGTLMLGGL